MKTRSHRLLNDNTEKEKQTLKPFVCTYGDLNIVILLSKIFE